MTLPIPQTEVRHKVIEHSATGPLKWLLEQAKQANCSVVSFRYTYEYECAQGYYIEQKSHTIEWKEVPKDDEDSANEQFINVPVHVLYQAYNPLYFVNGLSLYDMPKGIIARTKTQSNRISNENLCLHWTARCPSQRRHGEVSVCECFYRWFAVGKNSYTQSIFWLSIKTTIYFAIYFVIPKCIGLNSRGLRCGAYASREFCSDAHRDAYLARYFCSSFGSYYFYYLYWYDNSNIRLIIINYEHLFRERQSPSPTTTTTTTTSTLPARTEAHKIFEVNYMENISIQFKYKVAEGTLSIVKWWQTYGIKQFCTQVVKYTTAAAYLVSTFLLRYWL